MEKQKPLTTHEIINNWIYSAVEVTQQTGNQREYGDGVHRIKDFGVSEKIQKHIYVSANNNYEYIFEHRQNCTRFIHISVFIYIIVRYLNLMWLNYRNYNKIAPQVKINLSRCDLIMLLFSFRQTCQTH